LEPAVTPTYYEVRVTGILPPEALFDFEGLTATVQPVETTVYGPFQDQAELAGLLARLEALGVKIMGVRRGPDQDSAPP
jgi:hypothetical protein